VAFLNREVKAIPGPVKAGSRLQLRQFFVRQRWVNVAAIRASTMVALRYAESGCGFSRQRRVNAAEQHSRFEILDAAFTISNSRPIIPRSAPRVSRRIV
jgi:hypothetical protein